jgi:hypothetical protein
MRKVTKESVKAFLQHKNGKFGGVCTNQYAGSAYGKINTEVKDDTLYLFGNAIAKWENDRIFFRLCLNTNTSRERLSGLGLPINTRQYIPYIRGEKIDESIWYPLDKFVKM